MSKQYVLDLSKYTIPSKQLVMVDGQPVLGLDKNPIVEDIQAEYPLRTNLSELLRGSNAYKSGMEVCDAWDLARKITEEVDDELVLSETQIKLLQKVVDAVISAKPEQGPAFGGLIHIECIRRVTRAPVKE
jgi:hypothetical protein